MPLEREVLDPLARNFVRAMTSIRGRRVHRLVMREFPAYDQVAEVVAEDGSRALLALAADGRAAVCRSDGRLIVVAWNGGASVASRVALPGHLSCRQVLSATASQASAALLTSSRTKTSRSVYRE